MTIDPYAVLGVAADASIDQINAAYRRAARTHHPDAGGSAELFAELTAAVELLRDPVRRRQYDETGACDAPADDSIRGEAMQMMVQAFQTAIGGASDSFQHLDIVHATDAGLAQSKQSNAAEKEQALMIQRRVADALGRLSHKGDGPDVIRSVLEDQAATVGKVIAGCDRQTEVIAAARELLKAYAWTVDPRPTPSPADVQMQAYLNQFAADQRQNRPFGAFFGRNGV